MISPFTDETTQIYDKLISELEILTHNLMPPNNPHVVALHSLIEAVILTRSTREVSSAMALLQKVDIKYYRYIKKIYISFMILTY